MRYKNILMLLLFTLVIVSCEKTGSDELVGKGIRQFRLSSSGFNVVTLVPFAVDTVALVTIYRDEISPGTMGQTVTVTFEINSDTLDAYNTANGSDYLLMDPANYTLLDNTLKNAITPGVLTFAPGEYAKTISARIDTNPFDLTQKYAFPIVITGASTGQKVQNSAAGTGTLILQALPINKYDGVYQIRDGSMTDNGNAGLTFINGYMVSSGTKTSDLGIPGYTAAVLGDNDGPYWAYDFVTAGASTVDVYDPAFGGYYVAINSSGAANAYGTFAPEFTFDSNDVITSAVNYYGVPPNSRAVSLDGGSSYPTRSANKWTATGMSDLGFFMFQPSLGFTTPDNPRVIFKQTLLYLGPR